MASFPADTGQTKTNRKKKFHIPISSYPTRNTESIIPSFQAKIGWERPRKKESKNYRSDQLLPNLKYRIPEKKAKKIKKLKKYHYGFFSIQNRLGKAEIEGK